MKIGRIAFWLCLVLIPMLLPEFIAFVVSPSRKALGNLAEGAKTL